MGNATALRRRGDCGALRGRRTSRRASDAGEVHAPTRPRAVGQVGAEVRAAARGDETRLDVGHHVGRNHLGGAEGGPAVLVRVGLEGGEGAVERRAEQRQPADGVEEGGDAGVEPGVEGDVRGLVEEARLSVGDRAVVAADRLGEALGCGERHGHGGLLAARDAETKLLLHRAGAGSEWRGWPGGCARRSRGGGRCGGGGKGGGGGDGEEWGGVGMGGGRDGGDGLELEMDLTDGALGPQLDPLQGGELLGRQAGGGVLGALLGVLARGGRPEVGEGRERDRDGVPAVASRHGELGLVAATRERDRASARTGVWRGHRAGGEADAEARVLRRGRADFQLERSGGGGGGVGEGAVRRRLDEARRLERWHVHHLAIHHAKGWHHAPSPRAAAAHYGIIQFNKFVRGGLFAVKGNQRNGGEHGGSGGRRENLLDSGGEGEHC
mmetsp:Transcript_36728/g.112599  ORF Transcript_36728/g.112599 Transcript_36728/m.112599 type:complete len:439 (-) Transcript_36728:30-1346(-)